MDTRLRRFASSVKKEFLTWRNLFTLVIIGGLTYLGGAFGEAFHGQRLLGSVVGALTGGIIRDYVFKVWHE